MILRPSVKGRLHIYYFQITLAEKIVIKHNLKANGMESGFGGLGVACWPLVPKFEGSNPAEAVGFLKRKNPQHTFLRRGSKAIGPMS
jgi:hypothetical protein